MNKHVNTAILLSHTFNLYLNKLTNFVILSQVHNKQTCRCKILYIPLGSWNYGKSIHIKAPQSKIPLSYQSTSTAKVSYITRYKISVKYHLSYTHLYFVHTTKNRNVNWQFTRFTPILVANIKANYAHPLVFV